jgi:hypothetical protein
MKTSIAFVVAAVFATATFAPVALASEKAAKKPTKEQCAKDPKMKGCEKGKKK